MVVSTALAILFGPAFALGTATPAEDAHEAPRRSGPDEIVVVTATRLDDAESPAEEIPAHTTVITKRDIAASGARTVQDLLALTAGAVVYDQIGNDVQKSFDLRGFARGSGCAVFVDGARVNDVRNNAVALEAIPVDAVERIEVTRGSVAALAGGGSESGIVRIETRRGGPRSGSLTVGAGSDGGARYGARFEDRSGRVGWHVSAAHDDTDGDRVNSSGRARRLAAASEIDLSDKGSLRISVLASDLAYGAPGALTVEEYRADPRQNLYNLLDRSRSTDRQATLNYRGALGSAVSIAANLAWRRRSETSLSTGRAAAVYGGFALDGTGSSLGSTVQLTHTSRPGSGENRLVVGAEALDGDHDAAGWFTSPDDPSSFDGARPDSRNTTSRRNLAAFVQNTWNPSPRWSLVGGLRVDRDRVRYSEFVPDPDVRGRTSFSELSVRGGVVYRPIARLDLYASYGEGFLPPTAEQLFAFPFFGSNALLRPEDSRSNEAGLRWRHRRATASVAVFRIETRDEIVFDPDAPQGPFGANVNAGRTRRDGVEVAVRHDLTPRVAASFAYARTNARFRNGPDRGRNVPLVPRDRASLVLDARMPGGVTLRLDGSWVGSQVLDNDASNVEPRLASYGVVNVRIGWVPTRGADPNADAGGPAVFVEARNLFDRVYATRGIRAYDFATDRNAVFLTPAAGRRLLAGVTWRL